MDIKCSQCTVMYGIAAERVIDHNSLENDERNVINIYDQQHRTMTAFFKA